MSRLERLCISFVVWLAFAITTGVADAQIREYANAAAGVTISGNITDTRGLAVIGAVITARGTAVGWTATRSDGSFILTVPPGSYDVLVRKGGYTPATAVIATGSGSTKILSLVLTEANLGSVNIGSGRSGADVAFNTGVAATATLTASAISERPQLSLRDLALELPGVTLAHPLESVPDTSFVVRGGAVETRVQIDGHAVSAGATGRWNSSYASLPLFDSIEVVKGAALSGANAGESAFGTINLRTRDFSRGRQADLVLGADGFGGNFSTFALSGSLLSNDRFSYVLEHNVYGYNGPSAGLTVNNVVAEPNNTALLVSRTALDSPLMLGSDLAKLRWRFTGSTSLTLGYIGTHADYAQTGGAYGTFLGTRTIVPSAPGETTEQYSSPLYPDLIGQTVPAYTLAHNTYVQSNQPLFEAEFRTAVRNDTLLVRPYVGTIFNVLDGSGRAASADPSIGDAWTQVTSGSGCSTRHPCLVPDSSAAAFRDQELDRLHGTTVTYIHPAGDGSFNISYDYRSDDTTVASGNPNVRFDGTLLSFIAYTTSIPSTLARNMDWSATYTVPLGKRLRLSVGEYYTDWKLRYGAIDESANFVAGTASSTTRWAERGYHHDDPHFGFSWQPQSNTAIRLTAGSAITVPYAQLVAGGLSFAGIGTGNGLLSLKNPSLQPESTVAYDLGVDHRFRNGAVASVDAFDNTIHNVFAMQVTPFDAASYGVPATFPPNSVFADQTIPLNAPLERNVGLEISLQHAPVVGLGYRVTSTLQRAFLAQLPASFFSAQSSLVNAKQLSGATAIPYTHAYGALTYQNRSGMAASLGADHTGTNNWTNGPAFTVWSSMLRYDLRHGYRTQFSVENLFNVSTGTQSAGGIAGAGFTDVNYGAAQSGGLPTYGAVATTRFAIPARTFRLQVEAHVGR